MKKTRKWISLLCAMVMLLTASASAATPAPEEYTKEELYAAFMEIVEARNSVYFVPASFEEFGLTSMEEVKAFEEFYDNLIAKNDSLSYLRDPEYWAPYHIDDAEEGTSTRDRNIATATLPCKIGNSTISRTVNVVVTLNYATKLNPDKTKQIFDETGCLVRIALEKYSTENKWTTTYLDSGVNPNDPQQYDVYAEGTITLSGLGSVSDKLSVSFYCNDAGYVGNQYG